MIFTAAAAEPDPSKGSVSYRIGKLEGDLGFMAFHRTHPRISLTPKGKRLWHASQVASGQLDKEISDLRGDEPGNLSTGLPTYFASRRPSPRLTTFIENNPGVGLRIEPLNPIGDLKGRGVDMAVLWGNGTWPGVECELLFTCPAVPTANLDVAARIA